MKTIAFAIVVSALIVTVGGRYQVSATAFRTPDGRDGSRIYRLDRITGEVCTRPTQDVDWICYVKPRF